MDTHCWLWSLSRTERLSDHALSSLQDERSELFLSAASVWELAIKVSLGKIALPEPLHQFVTERLAALRLVELAVSSDHAVRLADLPPIHRDPFDRLLVAQAQVEGLVLMTADRAIARYEVELLWADRSAAPR